MERIGKQHDGGLRRHLATFLLPLILGGCNPTAVVDVSAMPNWPADSHRLNSLIPDRLAHHLANEPLLSFRGDPHFTPSQLTESERLWFERLWAAIENPQQHLDAEELSLSDNEYHFARALFEHNSALLLALRATGDLRLLDEIDQLAQAMRSDLRDEWCAAGRRVEIGSYRTMRANDGYLNFRRRHGSDPRYYCRDTADLEETLMHGHLAMLMYAYHVNRDLESPSGIDYGERADFWLSYLLNHFEAKWRERSAVRFPNMEFIDTKFCHTYNVFLLYHYYVGKRLQDDGLAAANAYLLQAAKMTDDMLDTPYIRGRQPGGFEVTSTPLGDAVVYSFGSPGSEADDVRLQACPAMYSRYLTVAATQLRLENFYRWDDELLQRIATGVAYYVMDTDAIAGVEQAFAAGVTGSEGRVEGIPRTIYRDRLDTEQYALTVFPSLGAWDNGERIQDISLQVYEEVEDDPAEPRRVMLPASFLLLEALEKRRAAVSDVP